MVFYGGIELDFGECMCVGRGGSGRRSFYGRSGFYVEI